MSARHVAALGGASLRIVKMAIGPRRGRGRPKLLRNKRGAGRPRKCYDLAPPELCAGHVVNWELDADNPVHMRALGSFLRSLRPVPGTSRCHLHTSPPCAPFSKAQWWNVARGLYKRDWRAAGVLRLRLMRRLHAEVRRSDVEWTSSHEQPQGSSLSHVQGAQDWPWALRRSASRQRVAGCAVGLRCASGFSGKAWLFESDSTALLSVLRLFELCPGGHVHVRMPTCCTECYPQRLGALFAAALMYCGEQ